MPRPRRSWKPPPRGQTKPPEPCRPGSCVDVPLAQREVIDPDLPQLTGLRERRARIRRTRVLRNAGAVGRSPSRARQVHPGRARLRSGSLSSCWCGAGSAQPSWPLARRRSDVDSPQWSLGTDGPQPDRRFLIAHAAVGQPAFVPAMRRSENCPHTGHATGPAGVAASIRSTLSLDVNRPTRTAASCGTAPSTRCPPTRPRS